MTDIFERATRRKLRYPSAIGAITTEDLWDLPLTTDGVGASLDDTAKRINRQLKLSEEESFVEQKTPADTTLALSLDVVKRVIEVRLADRERAAKAAETRAKKQKILELIANKEDEQLADKGIDDLQAMLNDL